MKTQTKKYIPLVAAIAVFSMVSFQAPKAEAVAKAIFPDASRLQPPPANIHADISHNIDNSGTVAPDMTVEPVAAAPAPAPSAPAASHSSLVWWIGGILILGAIVGYVAQKKK